MTKQWEWVSEWVSEWEREREREREREIHITEWLLALNLDIMGGIEIIENWVNSSQCSQ